MKFFWFFIATLLAVPPAVFANEYAGTRAGEQFALSDIPLYAISLIGTPYKFGGKSPETGMDCSGFVGHVFKQTAGVQLPASAQLISQKGQVLQTNELQPGDLVFFNTLNRAFSHVGIYLGDNRFVHSTSSSTGTVMVSNMTDGYWSRRFDGARRVYGTLAELPAAP